MTQYLLGECRALWGSPDEVMYCMAMPCCRWCRERGNTTNLKLQTERRMSYKLDTANCNIYPKKMLSWWSMLPPPPKKKLSLRVLNSRPSHYSTTLYRRGMLNSLYLIFIVLIFYSQQVSLYSWSNHNHFSGADLGFGEGGLKKKKGCVCEARGILLCDIHYLPCAPLDHCYYTEDQLTYGMTNRLLMYQKIFNYFCSVIFLKIMLYSYST